MRLQPKKNYQTNQLEAGLLQTGNGTHIVCNETQFKEGQLKNLGVPNLTAMAELIESQKVVYDFEYLQ